VTFDMQPIVVGIQVSPPRQLGTSGAEHVFDRQWTTGIFKEPVHGPVRARRSNLDGDGQADLKNHGGYDKAVYVYPAAHYPFWRQELERDDMPYGGFGENLTVSVLDEQSVCLGDIYTLGTARFEVSHPRQPCWKLARKWRIKDLSALVHTTGRTGWYFRVLEEGVVEAGQPLILAERPCPEWSIARAHDIMGHRRHDREASAALAAVPALAENWRQTLLKRSAGLDTPDATSWLYN